MSLLPCPECSHSVSTLAATCPECGFPMEVAAATTVSESAPAPSAPERRLRWEHICGTLLVMGAILMLPFYPSIGLSIGVTLLALCVLSFVPWARDITRPTLGLDSDAGWSNAVRVIGALLLGATLVFAGCVAFEARPELQRKARERLAETAPR